MTTWTRIWNWKYIQ